MELKMKSQNGFLLVTAIVLIIVIGMLGLVLTNLSVGQSESTVDVLSSEKAFFVASSGLENAKHDLTANQVSCNAFTKTGTLFGGEYKVTGQMQTAVSTTLTGNINAATTTIPVNNANAFPNSGIIQIFTGGVAENIIYNGKTSNQLLRATRGAYSSVAAGHSTGNVVSQQNVCTLISTGGIPTLANSCGKRIVEQQLLLLKKGGYLAPGQSLQNGIMPTVLGVGNIYAQGSFDIYNDMQNNVGCAMATSGNIFIQGDSPTFHCNKGGDSALWANNKNAPAPSINTSPAQDGTGFYNYFFTESPKTLMESGFKAETPTDINNVPNNQDVIYIDGDTTLSGLTLLAHAPSVKTIIIKGDLELKDVNIGSIDTPVRMIVLGDLTSQTGNGNFYGFIYVQGTSVLHTSSFNIYGAVASYGSTDLKNSNIRFDSSVFQNLGRMQIAGDYSAVEIFP